MIEKECVVVVRKVLMVGCIDGHGDWLRHGEGSSWWLWCCLPWETSYVVSVPRARMLK